MPSFARLLLGGGVGVLVFWLLASGVAAHPGAQYPSGMTLTPTPTATGVATATGTTVAGATAPNSPTIMGGRGRVANVRDRGFTVLWTTDANAVGQVSFGTTAALGSTATDQRGAAFSGRTHFVEIGGLTPNTTYFFDVVSGGVADNNAGQHYQIRTGPELAGGAPLGNRLAGTVLLPGRVAPAGGAIVWAHVANGNAEGTAGTSQILAVLSGVDGRYEIGLQPRTADLAGYFVYSTEGDLIEAWARHEGGVADGVRFNTAITQGGTSPSPAQIELVAASAAQATPAATATPTPGIATPVPTAAPIAAPAVPTATPGLSVPVQLPPLKEMALAQYPAPGQAPPPVVVTVAPVQPGYPGQGGVVQPIPTARPTQVAPPTPRPTQAVLPPTAPPAGPAVPPGTAGQPPAVVPTAPPKAPITAGVTTPAPTSPVSPGFGAPAGVSPGGTGAPLAPKPGSSFGQQSRDPLVPPPAGGTSTAVGPASPAPLGTLANLPPIVSALFYGGILIVAIGGGLAIWSVLSGTGWRPR